MNKDDELVSLKAIGGQIRELIAEFRCHICGEPIGGEVTDSVRLDNDEIAHGRCVAKAP